MKGLLFTYVLTYGGALAALFNPFVGLCIYVAFSILRPSALWPWSVPDGPYSKIVAVGMLAGWLVHGFGVLKFGRSRLPAALLLIYFLWCVLSAIQAPNQPVAWAYIDQMSKMHLPVLVGLTLVNSIDRLRTLAWVIVLCQGFVAFELNMSYLSGYNAMLEEGFAGMDNNSAAIAFVTSLGMAFFLGTHVVKTWQKAVCFGLAVLIAHAILISFSRGGMLAMVCSAFVGFLVIPKSPKHYLAFGCAVLLGLSLAGDEVRSRFATAFLGGERREASAQSRLDLWRDCWDVIQKNPIFGAGPDHWPLMAHEYGWAKGKEAHSLWVQNAAELGIPGVSLLLAFYLCTMWRLWPLSKESTWVPDPWFRDAARMVLTSMVGFIVSAQFVSLEALEIPYYVTLVGAGTLRLLSVPGLLPTSEDDGEGEGEAPESFDESGYEGEPHAASATPVLSV